MITVTIYNDEYECAKAVKGDDYVHLYDENNNCFLSCADITSFDGYSVSGGNWSMPDPSPDEMMRADLDYCLMMLE